MNRHLMECADESGVDLDSEMQSGIQTLRFMGHEIRAWYNEGACNGEAFVFGIGSRTSPLGVEQAIVEMKQWIAERGEG